MDKTIDILQLIKDCDETSATKCFTCINEIKKELFKMDNLENQKWIPVNERLPEKEDAYLVTRRFAVEHIQVDIRGFTNNLYDIVDHDFYNFSDKKDMRGWYEYDSEYGYLEDENIIAWMPLPKPYKE
jgi:hypothetical protein